MRASLPQKTHADGQIDACTSFVLEKVTVVELDKKNTLHVLKPRFVNVFNSLPVILNLDHISHVHILFNRAGRLTER